jgi:hypothetical protein
MLFYPLLGNKEIPSLLRFGGPGLGNLLFPYCRAYVYSIHYKGTLIPPVWPTIKFGPLLRAELDSRLYFGLFNSSLKNKISCLWALFKHQTVSEELFINNPEHFKSRDYVVTVRGIGNYFESLKGYEAPICLHLLSIINEKVSTKLHTFSNESIGLHIRMGDYKEEWRTPMLWYTEQIDLLKQHPKYKDDKIIIFSDGSDTELKPLLDRGCQRVTAPDALSDILRLSKCKIIIGSNSTFSAWAAFLSNKPFIRPNHFYMGRLRSNSELYEGDSLSNLLELI